MVDDPPSDDVQFEELEQDALEEVERDEDELSQTLQSEIEVAIVSERTGAAAVEVPEDRPTVKRAVSAPPQKSARPTSSSPPRPNSSKPPPRPAPSAHPSSSAPSASSAPGGSVSPSAPPGALPAIRPRLATQPPRPRSERPAPLPPPVSAPLSSLARPVTTPPKPSARPPSAVVPGKSLPPPRSLRSKPRGGQQTPSEPSLPELDEPTVVRDETTLSDEPTISAPVATPRTESAPSPIEEELEVEPKLPANGSPSGPPGIPSLAQREEAAALSRETPQRGKGKKGKRSTVKIPDDAVPTPGVSRSSPPPARESIDDDDSEDEGISDRPTEVLPDPPDEAHIRAATAAAAAAAAAAAKRASKPEPEAEVAELPRTRESAPGIFTDDQAIMVVRPVYVVSDLPPVQATTSVEVTGPGSALGDAGQPSARPPLPPRRTGPPEGVDDLEEIEEIIPDRMSLPGVMPDPSKPSSRRPLPPPRSAMTSDPGLLVDIDIEPAPLVHPTGMDALSALEAEAAAAEVAAQEAAAAAAQAQARARDADVRARDVEARPKEPKRAKKPWWAEWFEGDFVMTLDNPKRKDVQRESDFIEKSLQLEKGARVLDLGCGHGVHAVELAARGYQVVGVDVSTTMLQLAKEYAERKGAAVSFIQGDMRELNLEEVFDGIYCWSSSFGFFDEQRNVNVLERVWRALRPGGRFALDVPNRDFIAPRQPSMAWFERPGCVCMDEMKFDFYTSRLINKRMVMFDTGKSRELESSIRLYSLTELGRLLHNVGFRVLEVSGHRAHRGAYFGTESPRIIVTAERREKTDASAPKRAP